MSKLRVHSFSISIDGYGAGPNQDLQHPLGVGGPELLDWFVHTRTWQQHAGQPGRRNRCRRRQSRRGDSRTSARGYSAATCSAPCAARGRTTAGRAGGATSRRIASPVFVLTHHPRDADRDEGRHGVPFRHRRHRVGTAPGARCGARTRRPARRRRGNDPPISARRADRRAASRDIAACCSAPASICCTASTRVHSATNAPKTRQASVPQRTSCCANARDTCIDASANPSGAS